MIVVSVGTVVGWAASPPSASPDETLAAIRRSIAGAPGSWSPAWQDEYIETIHRAMASGQDASQFDRRLQILREGFGPLWETFAPAQDRVTFEIHLARIRWYVEHLMRLDLPDSAETPALRRQWKDLWDDAASSLQGQFSFLDPNIVERAKADHLTRCYGHIDSPLVPVFSKRFSEIQIEQIEQRWHDLRYARVELWQQLASRTPNPSENQNAETPPETSLDYALTLEVLDLFQGHISGIVVPAPDYYRKALQDRTKAQKQRLDARSTARSEERRLNRRYSRQLWQSEYLGFVLTALLETAAADQRQHAGLLDKRHTKPIDSVKADIRHPQRP